MLRLWNTKEDGRHSGHTTRHKRSGGAWDDEAAQEGEGEVRRSGLFHRSWNDATHAAAHRHSRCTYDPGCYVTITISRTDYKQRLLLQLAILLTKMTIITGIRCHRTNATYAHNSNVPAPTLATSATPPTRTCPDQPPTAGPQGPNPLPPRRRTTFHLSYHLSICLFELLRRLLRSRYICLMQTFSKYWTGILSAIFFG
jgi:hypothetical protein